MNNNIINSVIGDRFPFLNFKYLSLFSLILFILFIQQYFLKHSFKRWMIKIEFQRLNLLCFMVQILKIIIVINIFNIINYIYF